MQWNGFFPQYHEMEDGHLMIGLTFWSEEYTLHSLNDADEPDAYVWLSGDMIYENDLYEINAFLCFTFARCFLHEAEFIDELIAQLPMG